MELEDQLCAFEYAIKLKELGIKKPSLFIYFHTDKGFKAVFYHGINDKNKYVNAYTVAELGEMLPSKINKFYINDFKMVECDNSQLIIQKCDNDWHISYYEKYQDIIEFVDTNEVNARAKMLIWLIENKIIEVKNA